MTGSGPEGIDPGNGLGYPARGPVGRREEVHYSDEEPEVGGRCWGELSKRLAARNVKVGRRRKTPSVAPFARKGDSLEYPN